MVTEIINPMPPITMKIIPRLKGIGSDWSVVSIICPINPPIHA